MPKKQFLDTKAILTMLWEETNTVLADTPDSPDRTTVTGYRSRLQEHIRWADRSIREEIDRLLTHFVWEQERMKNSDLPLYLSLRNKWPGDPELLKLFEEKQRTNPRWRR